MLEGVGVSAGIGFAQALVWQSVVSQDYVPRKTGNPEEEILRLEDALQSIRDNNLNLRDKTARHFGKDEAVIFDAYELILSDEEAIVKPTKEKIRRQSLSAEYAVTLQFGELARRFLDMNDEYMRQRAEDVFGLRDQLLRKMMGIPATEANHLDRPTVIVATNLTASDIANLDLSRLEGIICEVGAYTSHMSIIARTLGIPTVVAARGALAAIANGDMVALDGDSGEIWVNPGEGEIRTLRLRFDVLAEKRQAVQLYRGQPTITSDGRRIELSANVGYLEEVESAIEADAESIGMYCTEMLHLQFQPVPTEEEQFEVYRQVLEKAGGKAVTVRTFDGGGRSSFESNNSREEDNPALGFRGIRLSLSRPSFFRTQLRALLRASAYGNLKVMFPMISNFDELTEAISALESIKAELRRENLPFDEEMPVGVLISVPSAALLANEFARYANFFTINVNDLIQFTLAIDQGSPELSYLYQQYHPAVLRLIKVTVDAAHRHGISCNISGDTPVQDKVLPLMLGLGLDGFSVESNMILPTRQVLNSCCFEDCRGLAQESLWLHSSTEVIERLSEFPLQTEKKERIS